MIEPDPQNIARLDADWDREIPDLEWKEEEPREPREVTPVDRHPDRSQLTRAHRLAMMPLRRPPRRHQGR